MSKQPEALRLADDLELPSMRSSTPNKAAAELRRLHEANAELLEALELAQKCMEGSTDKTLLPRTYKAVSAAIEKHGGTP